jgi:hypothetical protein
VTAAPTALGRATGTVVFLDVGTGEVRETLTLPSFPRGVAYTNGGRRVVTLQTDHDAAAPTAEAVSLSIWDIATSRPVGEPLALPAGAASVYASADGSRVVHGSDAGLAVVWDVDPGHWSALACGVAGGR